MEVTLENYIYEQILILEQRQLINENKIVDALKNIIPQSKIEVAALTGITGLILTVGAHLNDTQNLPKNTDQALDTIERTIQKAGINTDGSDYYNAEKNVLMLKQKNPNQDFRALYDMYAIKDSSVRQKVLDKLDRDPIVSEIEHLHKLSYSLLEKADSTSFHADLRDGYLNRDQKQSVGLSRSENPNFGVNKVEADYINQLKSLSKKIKDKIKDAKNYKMTDDLRNSLEELIVVEDELNKLACVMEVYNSSLFADEINNGGDYEEIKDNREEILSLAGYDSIGYENLIHAQLDDEG